MNVGRNWTGVRWNDEWLPQYCEFADNVCPNTVGVACWEQYLSHRGEREDVE